MRVKGLIEIVFFIVEITHFLLDQQRHSALERLGRRKMVAVFALVWQQGSASGGYFA
jgi:hypothetical protein